MGMSANQARFLSLTSRQVDLEYRMQQICHRRLRLASELEKIATKYNNALSDRKLFASDQTMYEAISLSNLQQLGFNVINKDNQLVNNFGVMNTPAAPGAGTVINSEAEFLAIVADLNAGTGLNGDYVLNCDIDLSDNGTFSDALIQNTFTGTFDGQGHTISGLTIDTGGAPTTRGIALFKGASGATISNLGVEDVDIDASASRSVSAILGYASNTNITNCYATGDIVGDNEVGGIVGAIGSAADTSVISDSYSLVNVDASSAAGSLIGSMSYVDVENSYATGDVVVAGNYAGGLVGCTQTNSNIIDSYATGDVSGGSYVGGITGVMQTNSLVEDSYSTSSMSGGTRVGALVGELQGGADVDTSFFNTSVYSSGVGNIISGTDNSTALSASEISSNAAPINGWDQSVWDLSGNTPTLIGTNTQNDLEEGLRNGTYSLVRDADSYTQDPLTIGGVDYEKVDWRTVATIDDDLDVSNDVDAENEYDSAVEKINSQDKKLQLEQSQVEVEHKAILTQKDAVKNILNKNIESSFKTFS